MKANVSNSKLQFNVSYIEDIIASGKGMSDVVSELKASARAVERRIFNIYERKDFESKIKALYSNDSIKRDKEKRAAEAKSSKFGPESTDFLESLASTEHKVGLVGLTDVVQEVVNRHEPRFPDLDKCEALSDKFIECLNEFLSDGLDYAMRQIAADDAVNDGCKEVDTTATRAELKRIEAEISSYEKTVSDSRSRLSDAEVAKSEAKKKVERAEEKLRRAKLEKNRVYEELNSAKAALDSDKAKLEELKERRAKVEKALDNMLLPTFMIVPSGNMVALKILNYSPRSTDYLDMAMKWSRKIAENFGSLTDSEFAVLGTMFGMLSMLKGKFKVMIDPSLIRVQEVYECYKSAFVR